MKSWRPKNWEELIKGLGTYTLTEDGIIYGGKNIGNTMNFELMVEAGADAILKALKLEQGIVRIVGDSSGNGYLTLPDRISVSNKSGWLVFIEDVD